MTISFFFLFFRKSTWTVPTADAYVEAALKTVGIESLTIGYLSHYLMYEYVRMMTYVNEKGTVRLIARRIKKSKKHILRIMMKEQERMNEIPQRDTLLAE